MVEDTAVAGTNLTKLEDEIREELADGEAVAVVLETREPSKKMLDLEAKIVTYQNKIRDYKQAIVESLAKRTTKFTKCPTCGSSVSIPHIKGIACPVCQSEELLMTNTHHKKLAGYQEYIDDYTARYNEALESNARAKVTNRSWLVVTK
jgi:DNA-directed RNA polymerase subunit RPC12/RpoP